MTFKACRLKCVHVVGVTGLQRLENFQLLVGLASRWLREVPELLVPEEVEEVLLLGPRPGVAPAPPEAGAPGGYDA